MAAFTFFDSFTAEAAAGNHAACLNTSGDVLKVYLTNATPSASTHTIYEVNGSGNLEEFSGGTGYTTGGTDTTNSRSQAGAIISVIGVDVSWTATAADWGAFAHVVLYNETQGAKLIGWWPNGSTVNLGDTQTFTSDFGATMFRWGVGS